MRKTARRQGYRAFFGFAAVTVAACLNFATPVTARPLDDVKASGVIDIAVYRDNAPYSWNENGEVKGIDVDIAKEIAAGLGVKLNIREQTAGERVSDDLRVMVWKGSVFGDKPADIMLHIPYNKMFGMQNPEAVLFAPYHRERFAFARDPAKLDTSNIRNLPDDLPIGVEIDTIPDFTLLEVDHGRLRKSVKHYLTNQKMLQGLIDGEVAGIMGTRTEITAGLSKYADRGFVITTVTVPPPAQSLWDIGMAVKENSRDLAYAVGDIVTGMADQGKLKEIFDRFGAMWEAIPVND